MFIKKKLLSIVVFIMIIAFNIANKSYMNNMGYDTESKCKIPAKIPISLKEPLEEATKDIPCYLLQSLRKIEIFKDNQGIFPRAMANARIIKVREDAINDKDIVNVLIHELGHVVDLGGLKSFSYEKKSQFRDGSLIFYEDDISLMYYKISWDHKGEKLNSSYLDFVGGYAKYDMFEDFSESFLLYIKHGKYFKHLALNNEKLKKKYIFFKKYVFNGKEFDTGNINHDSNIRYWDITKL